VNPGLLHRLDLLLGAPLTAGDDGSGVAHAAARRRGEAGDEADDRLLDTGLLEELGGFFLGSAPDLADHDNGLGLRVAQEEVEAIDEVGTVDRIATDTDAGGLSQADGRGLGHRLVG